MTETLSSMPQWMSIIPPIIAIGFALFFKEVISALLAGLVAGGLIIGFYSNGFEGMLGGLLMPLDFIVTSLVPDGMSHDDGAASHISVIIFSLLIGGMVGVITANGSMQALVNKLSVKATTKKRGQLVTWLMGIVIFFDDYANTLVVGNTMRPLTDKLKISREKLAYIVDSTAAPVAAIALVTTWIGAEVKYIDDSVGQLAGFPLKSGYSVFLDSLVYSFYPLLTLAFILMIILTQKDFGGMLTAESNVKEIKPKDEVKVSQPDSPIWKGVLPILIILFGTLLGLFVTGYSDKIWDSDFSFSKKISLIIGDSSSDWALMWSSFTAVIVAVLTSIRKFGLGKCVGYVISGFSKMLPAVLILVMAWSLAEVTEIMGTGKYISEALSGTIQLVYLPAITFVAAALIAFSTGSSWGTMAILYPVIIISSWNLGLEENVSLAENYSALINVISCVLAGSVLGDHCSPISDTTILTSLATECDHVAHVRTQMPYALTVGGVSLVFGTLLSSFGFPVWLCFVTSLLALYGILSYFGKMSTQKS